MSGLVHLYCGDGKGKTTAAMGLAVRCAGWQERVLVVQLMKQDNSGERRILEQLPQDLSGVMLFVPKLMFNADGMTLDEYHRDDLLASLTSRGAEVHVVSTMPHELLDTLEHILGIVPADSNTSTDPAH